MTTIAFAALQKQVALLTNGKALSDLNLRLLAIALEGMNVPRGRVEEELRKAIQTGRERAESRRIAEGGRHAPT